MFLQERELTLEDPIARALIYLADCCDGATSKDRRGFNGYDSSWGKALAAEIRQGHTLTPKERWDAFHKLKKHKRQLEQAKIQLPDRVSEPFAVQRDGDLFYVENLLKNSHHTVFTDGYAAGYCSCEAHSKWGRWCDHLEHVRSILLRDPKVIELLSFAPACEPPVNPNAPHVNLLVKPKAAQGLRQSISAPNAPDFAEKKLLEVEEEVLEEDVPSSPHAQQLSRNQLEAFKMAIDWYNSKPRVPFVLKGGPGVGKSFSIQRIVMELQDQHPKLKVALCSPTHKATHILKSMAQLAGLRDVEICTVHSLCHVMPGDYTDDGKQRLKENKDSGSAYYTDFNLVVVDESSMIGNNLLKFIPFESVPTIFMGDPNQLPPVEDDSLDEGDEAHLVNRLEGMELNQKQIEDALSGEQSPIFCFPCGIELTQVMRYEGAIADYVLSIQKDIEAQYPPRLLTKGNVSKMKDDEWVEALIDTFKRSENPNEVRALAWTNKRTTDINKLVRSAIYPHAEHSYLEGERLMAKEPIILQELTPSGYTRSKIAMYSCAECVVKRVKEGRAVISGHEKLENVSIYHMEVETDMGIGLCLKTIHESDWERVSEFFKGFKRWILELKPIERKSYWRDFYRLQEEYCLCIKGNQLLPRLQYAYALTVHQSQGSTFENVFVDFGNIMGCRQNIKQRNQLLYVACSRASKHLYALTKY